MENWEITQGFGTGALLHQPDARDYDIARIPEVAAFLAGDLALPDVVSYRSLIRHVYNQGSLPSCVAHSTAGMQTIYQQMEKDTQIRIYDAEAVYWENGGTGHAGIPTIRVLQYAKDHGLPEKMDGATTRRNRIESYAFTTDIDTICAALAAGHLVVFAMLLPVDFRAGDAVSPIRSTSYHQVVAIGYDRIERRLHFLNSWGANFGNGGCGSIPFDYLTADNNQNRYFYAYTTRDVLDANQLPDPTRVIVGIEDLRGNPRRELIERDQFVIRGRGFGSRIGSISWSHPDGTGVFTASQIISWNNERIIAVCPAPSKPLAGVTLYVSNPSEGWECSFSGLSIRPLNVTPVFKVTVSTYWVMREQSTRQVGSGMPFSIGVTGLPVDQEVTIHWGSFELPIQERSPQRITVLAAEVSRLASQPIILRITDTAQMFTGPNLSIYPVDAQAVDMIGT